MEAPSPPDAFTIAQYGDEGKGGEAEETGVSFDAYRDSKAAAHAERGRDFDEDTAKREFVAEYVQDFMFNDAKPIKALVNANAGLAGKMLNKIQFTIAENKLRKSGAPEAKAMLNAEKLYAQAFKDAKVKPNEANKAKAAGESVEYSSNRKRRDDSYLDSITKEQYDKYAWARIAQRRCNRAQISKQAHSDGNRLFPHTAPLA